MIKVSKRIIAHEKKAEHTVAELLDLIEENVGFARKYLIASKPDMADKLKYTMGNITYFAERVNDTVELG